MWVKILQKNNYRKAKPKNLKLWHNNNQELFVKVEYCAGVTPRPTQKRASKTLFQLGLVVTVINTLQRGLCTELMDILFAN